MFDSSCRLGCSLFHSWDWMGSLLGSPACSAPWDSLWLTLGIICLGDTTLTHVNVVTKGTWSCDHYLRCLICPSYSVKHWSCLRLNLQDAWTLMHDWVNQQLTDWKHGLESSSHLGQSHIFNVFLVLCSQPIACSCEAIWPLLRVLWHQSDHLTSWLKMAANHGSSFL